MVPQDNQGIGDVNLVKSRFAYRNLEYGLTLVGWRPPTGRSAFCLKIYFIWTVIMYAVSAVYLPVGMFLTYYIKFNDFDPSDLCSSLQIFFNSPGASVKITILLFNMWRYSKAKELLDELDKRCVTPNEFNEIAGLNKLCRMLFFLYQSMYGLSPTLMCISSLIHGTPPFLIFNPFIDWRESTKSFLICSLIEYIYVMVVAYVVMLIDCAPFLFSLTVRQHLKFLKKRIENLRKDPLKTEEEHYKELTLCIRDHLLIIEYCNVMRPLISRTIFSQFCTIACVLASAIISLLFFADFFTSISSVIYIAAVVFQSFPFSYTCDLIAEDCFNLSTTLFHSNWIGSSRQYKSSLIQFIQHTQQPIKFLGGGVFIISLSTNIQIAKFGFSLVTFIRHTNLFEKLQNEFK